MKIDFEFRRGDHLKPAIVFIHGLGMNRHIWTSPCEASMLGGIYNLSLLIKEEPEKVRLSMRPQVEPYHFTTGINPVEIRTSFHDLWECGYPVVTWSQRRPASSLTEAVRELEGIISFASSLTKKGIILVGHSRGGLVARRYLEESKDKSVMMLITISTPHRGSTMAGWVKYISPLTKVIEPFLGDSQRNRIILALKRITEFLKSDAIMELMPDSSLIKSLRPIKGVKIVTIAGTEPRLFSIWRWRYHDSVDGLYLVSDRVFSFPESFFNVIPMSMIPDEWIGGKGDGLVSVGSALFEDSTDTKIFNLNHARILIDRSSRAFIKRAIATLMD